MALYVAVVKPDEDGGFVAECPSIPGCISQGETSDEAGANLREAIAVSLGVPAGEVQVVYADSLDRPGTRVDPGEQATWCPECGPRVACDEDGCCAGCGATAVGDGATAALAALDAGAANNRAENPRDAARPRRPVVIVLTSLGWVIGVQKAVGDRFVRLEGARGVRFKAAGLHSRTSPSEMADFGPEEEFELLPACGGDVQLNAFDQMWTCSEVAARAFGY